VGNSDTPAAAKATSMSLGISPASSLAANSGCFEKALPRSSQVSADNGSADSDT
jgi:hypothetical protein